MAERVIVKTISNIGNFPESGVKRWTTGEVIAKL